MLMAIARGQRGPLLSLSSGTAAHVRSELKLAAGWTQC